MRVVLTILILLILPCSVATLALYRTAKKTPSACGGDELAK